MAGNKRISNLLVSPESGLQTLLEKAAILQQLTSSLRQQLDPQLGKHLNVANIRGNVLVITGDSSAWITRARFHAPTILSFVRQETGLTQLNKIHFKVLSPTTSDSDFVSHQPAMSESAGLLLDSTAKTIKDPALKEAILRLSRNRP